MTASDHTPIPIGMVGGGEGAFIGAIHRMAMRLTGQFQLVAGAFSSDPGRAAASAAATGVAADRSYASFAEMAVVEKSRPDGIRAVVIAAPNDVHHAAARVFLDHAFDIFCEKPLAVDTAQAADLVERAAASGAVFGVAHTYAGYAMVRHARQLIRSGQIGAVRSVMVEYPQAWLSTAVEKDGNRQAAWRTDPGRSGPGGALGDIGTHAFHLAEFVTGLRCEALAADLSTFVDGRRVDDETRMMLRFAGGARGMLWASQVAIGCANALQIRIFGSAGSLAWAQERPNELRVGELGGATRIIDRGASGVPAGVAALPDGHPEGYIEAFAQLYDDFSALIRSRVEQRDVPQEILLPGVEDGRRGMEFIEAAIRSHRADGVWTPMPHPPHLLCS